MELEPTNVPRAVSRGCSVRRRHALAGRCRCRLIFDDACANFTTYRTLSRYRNDAYRATCFLTFGTPLV